MCHNHKLQRVNFFENYAIVAMESDNVTSYACKIIKVTSAIKLNQTFPIPLLKRP